MTLNIALFLLGGLCCVVMPALPWTRSTTRNSLIGIHTEISGDVSRICGNVSEITKILKSN